MCGCLQPTPLQDVVLACNPCIHRLRSSTSVYIPGLEALCCMTYNFRPMWRVFKRNTLGTNDFSNPFAMLHHGDGRMDELRDLTFRRWTDEYRVNFLFAYLSVLATTLSSLVHCCCFQPCPLRSRG